MKKIKVGKNKYTMVDDDDFASLSKWSWHLSTNGRPIRKAYNRENGKSNKTVYLARVIMGEPNDYEVDHINRNILDNRKENLRLATASNNKHNRGIQKNNTSGYKGVFWNKATNKWASVIKLNRKRYWLGTFTNIIEAAKVYNEGALKYHGKFAYLNKIDFLNSE